MRPVLLKEAVSNNLSERQRETNVLMKGLQERFLLSGPKDEIVEGVIETGISSKGKKGPSTGLRAGNKGLKGSKKKRGSWWKLW